jgi:hypothetical protein
MVSKTLASLDAWLELAEEVLAEQDVLREKGREPEESDGSARTCSLCGARVERADDSSARSA